MEKTLAIFVLLIVSGLTDKSSSRESNNKSKSTPSNSHANRDSKQLFYSPFLFPGNYQAQPAGFPSATGVTNLSPTQYGFWSNLQSVPALSNVPSSAHHSSSSLTNSHNRNNGHHQGLLASQVPVTVMQQRPLQVLPIRNAQNAQNVPAAFSRVHHGNIWNYDDSGRPGDSSSKRDAYSYYFPFANADFGNLLTQHQQSLGTAPGNGGKTGFQRGNIESRPQAYSPGAYQSQYQVMSDDQGNFGGFVRGHVEAPPSRNSHVQPPVSSRHHDHHQLHHDDASGEGEGSSFNRGAVEGVPQDRKPSNMMSYNSPSDKKVVCYFANWAWNRKGKAAFYPEHINPMLCTHVIYAFSTYDKSKGNIAPSDIWTDVTNDFYRRIVALKSRNPDVKVLLSIGGWADSGDDKYSNLAHSPTARSKFARESLQFLKKYGFDGLAVDWHYPKCWQSNCEAGPGSDSVAFGDLLRELRTVYQPEGLLLSATLSGYKEVIDVAYHVPTLSNLLDLMNIMVYDYHGAWEATTGHVAPLYQGPRGYDNFPNYNANYTMEYYVALGADRSKLIMGIPMYGQSFELKERGNTHVGTEAKGPGAPGEFTQQPGMLAYYEICDRVRNRGWTIVRDRTSSWGPIAYDANTLQWVGYDDPEFVGRKARFVISRNYGGAFVWTMDLDDFNNDCCGGASPLLRTISKELLNIPFNTRQHDCTPAPPPALPPPPSNSTIDPSPPASGQAPPPPPPPPPQSPVEGGSGPPAQGMPCESSTFSHGQPDPNDCNTYYICLYNQIVTKRCSSGLHFNVYAGACDWPENAQCSRDTTTTTSNYWTIEHTTSTPSYVPQTSTHASVPVNTFAPVSEGECVNGQYLPAEECENYYLCTQGRKMKQRCGPGLHWNAEKKLCDWPSSAKCQASGGTKIKNKVIGGPNTDHAIRQQSCEEGSFSPSASECEVYYVCVHGKNVKFNCQHGLYWNQGQKVCDWPANSDCNLGGSGGGSGTLAPVPPPMSTRPPMYTTTTRPTSTSSPWEMPTMSTSSPTTMRPPSDIIPMPGPGRGDFMVVCYYTNWAIYRQGMAKYTPQDIDHSLCTHVVYGFAILSGDELLMKVFDSWADIDLKMYEHVTALKAKGIKVSIALGGWNDSLGDKYSRLVNNPSARARFVRNAVEFVQRYNFDGMDLDWEYPKCWQVDCDKGPSSDKPNFAALVRELKEAFRPHGYLLSAAVSPSKTVVDQGYDVPTLSRYLDWIAVMTYDFHGQWDKKTGHVAPLYLHEEDDVAFFNANYSLNYWINKGADRRKIVMGMPLYGQSFTLVNPSNTGLNSPTSGGGTAGMFTRASGFLAYYEICKHVQRDGWTVVQDPSGAMGPYAYRGNQWVSYDDVAMIAKKSQLIRDLDLGGGMIWALDLDDFKNNCGEGRYPLLSTIRRVLAPPRGEGSKLNPVSAPSNNLETHKNVMGQQNKRPGHNNRPQGGSQNPVKVEGNNNNHIENDVCSDEPFRPHPTDCTKYYQCLYGRYIENRCPPGTFWNTNRCDWTCGTSSGSSGTSTTTTRRTSARPTFTTQRPTTSTMATYTTTMYTTPRPGTTSTPSGMPTQQPLPPSDPLGSGPKCPAAAPKPEWGWEPATATEMNTAKPLDVPSSDYKVVCYFTNWAWYRPGKGRYKPSDIDFNLCTHIAYGFAVLDPTNLVIRPHDGWADLDNKFYRQVVQLKARGLKVVLAIGGWNDSAGDKYSKLVNNPAARRRFITHVIEFLEKHCFDGLDLDWEYPKCWQVDCNKGPASDKQAFADFVRELSDAFRPRGLLLSTAVSPSKTVIDEGYDVPVLSRYFDWISVMTYDYHGQWDKKTGHVAPMYFHEEDDIAFFNTNYTINYWIQQGADRKKLIMGMPMYGQSFTLVDPKQTGLNSKSSGGGTAGEFTRQSGFLAYYEICHNILNRGWKVIQDDSKAMGPYAHSGNQWVSFDDINMIQRKSQYIKDMKLGGGMIWALDLDDFKNTCNCGRHPLLKTINRVLRDYRDSENVRSCMLS